MIGVRKIVWWLAPFLFQATSGFPVKSGVYGPVFIVRSKNQELQSNRRFPTAVNLLDKLFEEEGPLGKGITVGKVQVALLSSDRGENSIFAALEDNARWMEGDEDERASLADLAHDICLTLLRKKDSWIAAHSDSMWFSAKDAGKAEAKYNEWANVEAAKFEKVRNFTYSEYITQILQEYIPDRSNDGGSTHVVVSLVIEIEGDSTKFDGAGFSMSGTQAVLNSIASNCLVDDGEVTNAVEVFWTPGDPKETLTSADLIVDFPELVTL